MSTTAAPTPPPSPSPAAPVPPPAAPAADIPPTVEAVEKAISSGTSEDLGALMRATAEAGAQAKAKGPDKPAAPAAPTAAPAATPAAEPAAAATPPAHAEVIEEAGKPKQFRLRGRDEQEGKFLELIRAGKTVPEATAEVYGATPPAAKPPVEMPPATPPVEAPPPAAADPAKAIDERVTAIDTELAQVRLDLKKANEDMDADKQTALQEKLADLKVERTQLADQKKAIAAQAELSQQATAQQAAKKDFDGVVELYPALGKKDSPERVKFDAFVKERSANPEYDGVFASPRWRSILAREWAELEGVVPAKQRQATPPAAPAAPTPPPKADTPPPQSSKPRASAADVIGAKDGPSLETFEITPASVEQAIAKITDPKEISRVMEVMHQQRLAARPR